VETVPMRGVAYAQSSDSPEQFEDMLEKLVDHASSRRPAVTGADLNAWATEWGSRTSNPIGRAVIDDMNLIDLVLLNDGLKLTFNNDRGRSFIDVTFLSRVLVATSNWMVHEDIH